MKYTIIGSGPTGLSLAYILGINGYNIDLIEQSSTLGGSWNSEFIDKDFWSENSPRVIVTGKYTKYLLQNIGMNKEISIGDLVKLISKLIDKEVDIIATDKRIRPKKSEVERLVCDNSKLKKFTLWEPKYSLETGLNEVIEWMKKPNNFSKYKPELYTV